jgi:hypothetical protein
MRLAAIGVPLVLLLAVAGCREGASGPSPLTPAPGASVNQDFNDIESTLERIESELNNDG